MEVKFIFFTSQVSTFAINYRGHPFMESLTENRSLLYSLAGAGGFVVMLALGWLPEFSDQFSIVDFSDEFRSILLQVFLHNISALHMQSLAQCIMQAIAMIDT